MDNKQNTPGGKKDYHLEKRELKSGENVSEEESGHGTGSNEKSSASASPASDSTSGIDVKGDVTAEKPLITDSRLKPDQYVKSPTKSPRKSPVRKVQEGLSWVKRNLSPKKSEVGSSSTTREHSVSPKACRSPKKSPHKSPRKSPFRNKSKSFRYSSDEVEPFALDDELRYSSSSNDDVAQSQGAIPKTRRSKHKSKERNTEVAADCPSGQATKSTTQKFVDAFKKSPSKKMTPVKTKKKKDPQEKQQPVPFSRQVSEDDNLKWSDVRVTTDDEVYTASPSEIDLSSMSSYKFADFPDLASGQIEKEASSVAEKLADMVIPDQEHSDSQNLEAEKVKTPKSASVEQTDQDGSRRPVQSESKEIKELGSRSSKSSPKPKKSPKSQDKNKNKKRETK